MIVISDFNTILIQLILVLQILLVIFCSAHETIEEAKAAKHATIKKYYKKLRKQDGAIRLIGGRNEYEGE